MNWNYARLRSFSSFPRIIKNSMLRRLSVRCITFRSGRCGEVVRLLAEQVPVLILQAKTDTDSLAADNKASKSSLAFNESLLRDNGFPHVDCFTARGWTRPLLVGRREKTD